MALLIEVIFFLKRIFEVFGKTVKYWEWPQNRSLNYLSFDWVSDHVQTLAHCKCLPGVVSFSSREQIQGSQTSIMWGLNHLSPNKSTYSLIPSPPWVSFTPVSSPNTSPHAQRADPWKLGEEQCWTCQGFTHQQGLKASARGFLVETVISKLEPHPLGL